MLSLTIWLWNVFQYVFSWFLCECVTYRVIHQITHLMPTGCLLSQACCWMPGMHGEQDKGSALWSSDPQMERETTND